MAENADIENVMQRFDCVIRVIMNDVIVHRVLTGKNDNRFTHVALTYDEGLHECME